MSDVADLDAVTAAIESGAGLPEGRSVLRLASFRDAAAPPEASGIVLAPERCVRVEDSRAARRSPSLTML